MPAKTTTKTTADKKLKSELAKAKKEITHLKKKQTDDLLKLAEEAYFTGYTDAMVDMDEKAEAMDKFIEKSLNQFEKEYNKKLAKPKKPAKKKSTTKNKTKKRK